MIQHIVTLYLIGWSYFLNFTCENSRYIPSFGQHQENAIEFLTLTCMHYTSFHPSIPDIGVAIFFSMDIADVFLALSKMLNYMNLQRTSEVSFAALLIVWTYFRHYQNLRILYSIWYEMFVYSPEHTRVFEPFNGVALAPWIRHQMFLPIAMLQLLNLFWYFLMWRIVWRWVIARNFRILLLLLSIPYVDREGSMLKPNLWFFPLQ